MTSLAAEWNHNSHYHRELLRAVPKPCRRALDVGCGYGEFARLLAERAEQVDALDQAREVIAQARQSSVSVANLRYIEADLVSYPLENSAYDFISAIASLHHLPFATALGKLRAALRPGGVLVVLSLYHDSTLADLLASAVGGARQSLLQTDAGIIQEEPTHV